MGNSEEKKDLVWYFGIKKTRWGTKLGA